MSDENERNQSSNDNEEEVSLFLGNLKVTYTANDLQSWLEDKGVRVNGV